MKIQESALAWVLGFVALAAIAGAAPETGELRSQAVLENAKVPAVQPTAPIHCDVSPFVVTVISTKNPSTSWYPEDYCGSCSTSIQCGPGTQVNTVCGSGPNWLIFTCQPQGPICTRDHGQMCDCLPVY